LNTLKYETCPDYDMMLELFRKTYTDLGGTEDTNYDWESKKDFDNAKKLEQGLPVSYSTEDSTSSESVTPPPKKKPTATPANTTTEPKTLTNSKSKGEAHNSSSEKRELCTLL